jgi:hypothetical protein
MGKGYPFWTTSTCSWYSTFFRARARELPGHSLFVVTKRLIKVSTDQWEVPSYGLLRNVYQVLVKEVNGMVDERFSNFRYGRLHQDVK